MEGISNLCFMNDEIKKINVNNLRNFLLSKGITVSKSKKVDLVKLAKTAIHIGLGLEDNVYFHKDLLDLLKTGNQDNKYTRLYND